MIYKIISIHNSVIPATDQMAERNKKEVLLRRVRPYVSSDGLRSIRHDDFIATLMGEKADSFDAPLGSYITADLSFLARQYKTQSGEVRNTQMVFIDRYCQITNWEAI